MPKSPFKPPASYEAAMEELEQLTGGLDGSWDMDLSGKKRGF